MVRLTHFGKQTADAVEHIDGRTFLTYRGVIPEVWNLIELDRAGTPRPMAYAPPFVERPLIALGAGSVPTLSGPWRTEISPR